MVCNLNSAISSELVFEKVANWDLTSEIKLSLHSSIASKTAWLVISIAFFVNIVRDPPFSIEYWWQNDIPFAEVGDSGDESQRIRLPPYEDVP